MRSNVWIVSFCLAALGVPQATAAEQALRLKVMTFNIHYGGDQWNAQAVIDAIKAADPDIIGLQEPDATTRDIAARAGYPYVDIRRHIISRYPLFDSGVGERTESTNPPYSIAGVGDRTVHAWALLSPGLGVALANTHLSSDPYGPELVREGKTLAEVLDNEAATRVPEAKALVDGLAPIIKQGVPVFLTGDFNTPSRHDWTEAVSKARPAPVRYAVDWPVSRMIEEAGFIDSYRAAHPDPVTATGLTWTPGYPFPYVRKSETHDRIDYVYAANARTIDSAVVGETGNSDVAIPVAHWTSDHRAVVSTFEVVPARAPALIAVEPQLVTEGKAFTIRVNTPDHADWGAVVVPRDGDPVRDAKTGITGVSAYDRTTLKLSTLGLAPGAYDAVMIDADGKEVARNRFSIVAADEKAKLAVEKTEIPAGSDIVATWSGAPGYRFDWVGLYRRGEVNVYNYLSFTYTGARREGTMTIAASDLSEPLSPGDYEVRLLLDDHYQTLAIAPFTVVAKP
jgi:endonuclease/exonuclease/phosphatase family metal-dependent hydrolase